MSSKQSVKNIGKYFKLLDFHVYDNKPILQTEDSDNSSVSDTSVVVGEEIQFTIQMFGLNESGETCCIYINDYKPFFYIKVGDDWDNNIAQDLLQYIQNHKSTKYIKDGILSAKIVEHNTLYGFTGGKTFKFVLITFKNIQSMNKVKNMWYRYTPETNERKKIHFQFMGYSLELYESSIAPLLRYFHIQNISPSGWVRILTPKCRIPVKKTTTCTYEYICSLKYVVSSPERETRVPYKICSFDIEASSSHGDFPLPKKTYKRLASNIVDIFQKQILSNIKAKNILTQILKKSIHTAFGFGELDDIDLVYPLYPPSKETVNRLITHLLNSALDDPNYTDVADSTGSALSIENIFEKMKESVSEEVNPVDDMDQEDTDEVSIPILKKSKALSKKGPEVDKTTTILDMLVNEDYSREEKIEMTNLKLCKTFPPLQGDKVTFIGSTFLKYGESTPYLNHCLVLGSCDPVEDAEIQTVEEESDLLTEWTNLIQRENPDIIIGYNIFGFDYEFMFRRAEELHIEEEFFRLSRVKNQLSAKEIRDKTTSNITYEIENTKMAIASGEYDLRYFNMCGRLQIDMYAYFRRDFNLSSYKLDDVAGQYISDDIKKVDVDAIAGNTRLFSSNLAGLHKDDFIHIEISGFSSDYYENGKKFRVLEIEYDVIVEEIVKGIQSPVKYNVITIEGNHGGLSKKKIKWGMAKDDVTPQDIFRLANGSSADRAIVAKYCIQDCNLVHHLMNKIDVITGYVEMSRICSVPISYLVFRGQGVKLTSYVAKKCRDKNTLMPDLEKGKGNEGYEGAIVLPPKCGIYMDNPVACVDYSSLYPSSMISQNYSHDSKVWTKEYDLQGKLIRETGERRDDGTYLYDNLPGYEYIHIEFDTFKWLRNPERPKSREVKTKVGKKICCWAQLPEGQKSIMPSILEELLQARSDTRKQAKGEKDPFMQNILDKRQLGYKVTANSLYGQCGARTSTFYEKDVAASTTATGRMMITYAKRIIEEVYGDRVYDTVCQGPVRCKAEYIYGDSVANYTPVTVRLNGADIIICTIEELAKKYGQDNWITCKEPGKQTKEYCELSNIESWTESGWTPLYRVIRHTLAEHKKMIRILTHTGLVDVTDDHSLITSNGLEISPQNCNVGTQLLHNQLIFPENNITSNIKIEEAYVMGFFFGDGSCGIYNCPSGKKNSWALNNASYDMLDKYLNLCKIAYPQFEWVVLDTIESSGVYKIGPKTNKYGAISEFVKEYRKKMYYESSKVIPLEIMKAPIEIRKAFWDGLYDADGDKDANGYVRIDQKNQISASHIASLAKSLGWKTSINIRNDKPNIYRITMTKNIQRKNPYSIKKIFQIPYEGYVYDLTTENHHFAAGIGNLIVHNTDSVFFTFNLENPDTKEKIRGKPALEATIEIAQDAANLCTKYLKPPMALAYEKTLMPFMLLSKKRYVGMLYEEDPNKGKLKFMGLVLKRRDNCDLVKDVYGGILDYLMKENLNGAIDFLNRSLQDLIDSKVPMEKLSITKALRGDYKNPQQIAHRVLADRIGKRDPGNKPKSGDRIKYIYIVNANKTALQGDKIETPEFIIQNNILIDYTHYITNQLMKPLQQLFGLALVQIWENNDKQMMIRAYNKDMIQLERDYPMDGSETAEIFMKKKEKYCSQKIKTILFDPFLQKIYNKQNGIQTLDMWMKK
jgi:DNA polymerase elongation subunit (family B)